MACRRLKSYAIGGENPTVKVRERQHKAMEKQLKEVSTENDRLKRLLAEKELQLAILKDLMNCKNPR
ncbi:hypothetical protein RDV78_10965 [Bacillota bacterium LX-D]|nr:hypothetical protein [Bacillota bacterium LX-D]